MRWFKKFLRLAWTDKWLVVETWGEILRIMILLRSPLRPRLFKSAPTMAQHETISRADLESKLVLIQGVCRYHIKPVTCLERVLATQAVLGRRHIPLEVQIGVAKSEIGLDAHAWLTYHGRSLEDATQYSTLNATS